MSIKSESLAEAMRRVLEKSDIAEPLRTVCAGVVKGIGRVNERLLGIDEVVRNGGRRKWPWDELESRRKFAKAAQVRKVAFLAYGPGRKMTVRAACRAVASSTKGGYACERALNGYCNRPRIRAAMREYVEMVM